MARTEVKSEITGAVWKILVKPGDKIAAEEPLIILESMKMEIPVLALDGGKVTEVLVKEGDAISEGQTVAIMET
jgi:biotin carboxyl carrier protein